MSILKRDDLLNSIRARIGDDTSDEALKLIEDVEDTLGDLETKAYSESKWEQKYKENDDAWRKKYRDRFFNKSDEQETDLDDEEPEPKPLTYDALFKEGD